MEFNSGCENGILFVRTQFLGAGTFFYKERTLFVNAGTVFLGAGIKFLNTGT